MRRAASSSSSRVLLRCGGPAGTCARVRRGAPPVGSARRRLTTRADGAGGEARATYLPPSPDAPPPPGKITKEANRAFKKSRDLLVLSGYAGVVVGLGVGTMVTTATYIYFQWRQYELNQRRVWIELKRRVLGESEQPSADGGANDAAPPVDTKEQDDPAGIPAQGTKAKHGCPIPIRSRSWRKGGTASDEKEGAEKAMVPGVGRIGGKLRMLNVPLDLFPSSMEEFMVKRTVAMVSPSFYGEGHLQPKHGAEWHVTVVERAPADRLADPRLMRNPGTLKFRTLFERSLYDMMFRNQAAVKIIGTAANRTAVGRPFLEIPPAENWYVLNNILNEISSLSSIGFIQADAGAAVRMRTYVFGLTCEKEKSVWNRKLRVMMIDEGLLKRIPELPTPRFEEPHHSVRWSTLQAMARLYRHQEEEMAAAGLVGQVAGGGLLGKVELAVPLCGAHAAVSSVPVLDDPRDDEERP